MRPKLNPNVDFIALLKQIAAKRKTEAAGSLSKETPASRASKKGTPRERKLKGMKPGLSRASAKKELTLGAAHFLEFIFRGEAEWTLLAVRAPRKNVTDALAKLGKAKNVARAVPIKKAAGNNNKLARLVAVIQVNNTPWTVVYWSLFWFAAGPAPGGTMGAAKDLSKLLKTQAVSFAAEDTSGAFGYELFEKGNAVESADWCSGGGFELFESTRRQQPDLEEVDCGFADKLFRELGIYLPVCYPMSQGKRSWLAVGKASLGVVEQADLLAI